MDSEGGGSCYQGTRLRTAALMSVNYREASSCRVKGCLEEAAGSASLMKVIYCILERELMYANLDLLA